jgi:hypothetical protein
LADFKIGQAVVAFWHIPPATSLYHTGKVLKLDHDKRKVQVHLVWRKQDVWFSPEHVTVSTVLKAVAV